MYAELHTYSLSHHCIYGCISRDVEFSNDLWPLLFEIEHEGIWRLLDVWPIFILLGWALSFSSGIKHRVRAHVSTVYNCEGSSSKTRDKL